MFKRNTLKFAVKYLAPSAIIATLTSLLVFSYIPLNAEEFTLIYWILSIVILPLNYKAKRWTDYIIKHHGLQMEKNPVMREMYKKGKMKNYWIAWLGIYLFLFMFYAAGINARNSLPLIFPSALLGIILYDFLNDFSQLRKLKKIKLNGISKNF